jgi:hypothetical protein
LLCLRSHRSMKLVPWLKSRNETRSDQPTSCRCWMPTRIARLRQHYESKTFADRFYALASECIREIYGPLAPKDFKSHSAMRGFFATKQNLMRDLMRKRSGSTKR